MLFTIRIRVFDACLTDIVDRWQCVLAAINISRTLKLFIQQGLIVPSKLRFDIWHDRNTKKIRLGMTFVEIEYEDSNHHVRMQNFYNKTAAVPHLEHLYQGGVGPFNENKQRIRLLLVGCDHKPSSAEELSTVIRHICKCLFELHALKYVHCDIRWNNIVDVFGEWYLIDCEYACSINESELLVRRSAETCHKRYVLNSSKPWCPMFDLYQVGMLIAESDVHIDENSNLAELRKLLLSKSFTVASFSEV